MKRFTFQMGRRFRLPPIKCHRKQVGDLKPSVSSFTLHTSYFILQPAFGYFCAESGKILYKY
jgi:hypothetical protein